jgi:hypothetical protein
MTHQIFQLPKQTQIDSSVRVTPGAKANFYATTTTTPQDTYTTSARNVAHANPVVADANGVFPAIYLDPALQYKLTLTTSADVLIYTVDPVNDQLLSAALIGQYLFPRTAAEIAAGVTPTDYDIQPQNPMPIRVGAVGDGTTDDTSAIAASVSSNPGSVIDLGGFSYEVNSTLPASPLPTGAKFFNGEIVCPQVVIPSLDRYSVTVYGSGALAANTFIPEANAAGGGIFYASGNHIVAIGTDALNANTEGRRMTAIGSRSLLSNTSGYYNTGCGSHTLEQCTTGYENTALGVQSLQFLTTGHQNIGVGPLACGLLTTGNDNVGVGRSALRDNLTSSNNTAVGTQAGLVLTSANNTVVGFQALSGTTSGDRNTVMGATACGAASTASQVSAFGYRALLANTANNNSAFGTDALISNTSGTKNAAFGYSVLGSNVTGINNAGFADGSLILCTGDNNAGFGVESLTSLTTGDRCSALGYSSGSGITTEDNATTLGYNAQVTGSNQLQLGDSNTTSYAYGAVQNRSDARDKADVRDTTLGLSFINALRPVDYRWNYREDYGDVGSSPPPDDSKKRKRFHQGLIAQEVRDAMDKLGVDFGGFQDHSIKGGKDVLSIGYAELVPVLIKAVQELSAKVSQFETERDNAKALWGRM